MNKNKIQSETLSFSDIVDFLDAKNYMHNALALLDDVRYFPFQSNPRLMQDVFIGLCLEGEINISIDAENYIIGKNQAFVITASKKVSDFSYKTGTKAIGFFGTAAFFQEVVMNMVDMASIFLYIRRNPVQAYPEELCQTMKFVFDFLQDRIANKSYKYRRPLAATAIRTMIYDMANFYKVGWEEPDLNINTKGEKVFNEFVRMVEKNFRSQRRVSWYAAELGISAKYLSELVKAVSNETPNTWIDRYVIMELRLLLRDTTLNIKQITDMMNFPNQSFLGKFFKEHVGISPSQYRRKI